MLVLYLLAICFVLKGSLCRVEAVPSSVRVTTIPKQGPFRLGQTVQFSCEVEPAQSAPVTYQWRNVEYVSGSSIYFSKSFNTTYNTFNLRYSWYFCTVTLNRKFFGSANKLVELHGLLQTDEQITRAFSLHKRMVMRINISDYRLRAQNISSLAWYHNGTKLTSDYRVRIANNATSLIISNMRESDAGKYEVKINSVGLNPEICNRNILPMLEKYALYAPVTFLLQQSHRPTYNPADIIMDYVLPAYQGSVHQSFAVDNTLMFNAAAVLDVTRNSRNYLYRNGVRVQDKNTYNMTVSYDNVTTQSLRITYNNSDDIAGYYVHQVYSYYVDINREICPGYYYFNYHYYYPIFTLYWNIRSYAPKVPPSSTTAPTNGMLISIMCFFLVLCGALVGVGALMVYSRCRKNRSKAKPPSSFPLIFAPLVYADITAPPRYEDIDFPASANASNCNYMYSKM